MYINKKLGLLDTTKTSVGRCILSTLSFSHSDCSEYCMTILNCVHVFLLQILLYENSSLDLFNNKVSELGAGIYVEFASSDFVLSVLNTGCFIRYFSTKVGIPPTEWVRQIFDSSFLGVANGCPAFVTLMRNFYNF